MLSEPNLLKMLTETRFADGLNTQQLQCLCRAARMVQLTAGARLFREGDLEDEIFIVSSGHVRLSMNVPGRGEVAFLTAGAGDLVGWSGLIGEGKMTATAVAVDDCVLIALSGARLKDLCASEAELGCVLMKRVAQVLSGRLLSTRLQLLDLFGSQGAT